MQTKSQTLSINEDAPCQVAYINEDGTTFAKLKKDDLEAILRERRQNAGMVKVWMLLAAVAAVMLGGSTYWFSTHPVQQSVPVAPMVVEVP